MPDKGGPEAKGAAGGERILIITGMSGAGKSRAVMALEDLGFFCVDNLPPALFAKFIEGMRLSHNTLPKMAIVADIRSGPQALPEVETTLAALRKAGVVFQVVYLEASNDVLLQRYKENRRPHPLEADGLNLIESIREERRLLEGLRAEADIIIDTTTTMNQKLVLHLGQLFGDDGGRGIIVSLASFGFKYGLPVDADMVVDVRFLPNPYYIPELKPLTGLDARVMDFVLSKEASTAFLRHMLRLVRFLLPQYQNEGKKHFTLAVGCTGGRHRSVALAERIAKRLRASGYTVAVAHRDIERAGKR